MNGYRNNNTGMSSPKLGYPSAMSSKSTRSARPNSPQGTDPSATARTHFIALYDYLQEHLAKETPNSRSNAREKLTRLSKQQFAELSTDVYDELTRRLSSEGLPFLPVRPEFHPKRNQARQKLATLPSSRFKDLAGDVFYELQRRYPEFKDLGKQNQNTRNSDTAEDSSSRPFSKATSDRSLRTESDDINSPRSISNRRPSPPQPEKSNIPRSPMNMNRPRSPTIRSDNGSAIASTSRLNTQTDAIIPNKSTIMEEDDASEVQFKQGVMSPTTSSPPGSPRDLEMMSPREGNGTQSAYYDKMSIQSRTVSQASSVGMTRFYNGLSMASNISARSNGIDGLQNGPDGEGYEKMRSDYEFRIATMQDKITALERQLSDLKADSQDIKDQHDAVKDENINLQDRLEEMSKYHDGLKDENIDLKDRMESVSKDSGDHQSMIRRLEEELEEQTKVNNEQLQDLKRLEAEIVRMREDLDEQNSERNQLAQKLEKQTKINNDQQQNLMNLEEEIERMREEQLQHGSERDELAQKLERQTDLNNEQLQNLRKLEDEITSLREDLDFHRSERDQLAQKLESHRMNKEGVSDRESTITTNLAGNGGGNFATLQRDYENLDKDHRHQQALIDDVRKEAMNLLDGIKALSERNEGMMAEREQDMMRMQNLQNDVQLWRKKYEKAKTDLRNVKATSTFYPPAPDLVPMREDFLQAQADGAIEDSKITTFQVGIDDLLSAGRSESPTSVLAQMQPIIMACKGISEDIDFFEAHRFDELNADEKVTLVSLKNNLNATLSNLTTASKNHASGMGMSPVSLLDAAASHLAVTVVDLCKLIRVRPAGDLSSPPAMMSRSKVTNEQEQYGRNNSITSNSTTPGRSLDSPKSMASTTTSRDMYRQQRDRENPAINNSVTASMMPRSPTPSKASTFASAAAAAVEKAANAVLPSSAKPDVSTPAIDVQSKPSTVTSKWFGGFGRKASTASNGMSSPSSPPPRIPLSPSPPLASVKPLSMKSNQNNSVSESTMTRGGGVLDRLGDRNPVKIMTTDADGRTEMFNPRSSSPLPPLPPGKQGSDANNVKEIETLSTSVEENEHHNRNIERQYDDEIEEWNKLKTYLETQTEAIVQSIQSLLSSIRSGSFGPTLSLNLTQIITIVTCVVAVTQEGFSEAQGKVAGVKSRGDAILRDLEASCERLSQEMQRQEEDRELSKASKQKMASASFDIARYLKELVSLFDEEDDDEDDLDYDDLN